MCYACTTLYEIIDTDFLLFIGCHVQQPVYTLLPCLEMPALVAYTLYKRGETYEGLFDDYFDAKLAENSTYPASMWEYYDRRCEPDLQTNAYQFIGPVVEALDEFYTDEPKHLGVARTFKYDQAPAGYYNKKFRFVGYNLGIPFWVEDANGMTMYDIRDTTTEQISNGRVHVEILSKTRHLA